LNSVKPHEELFEKIPVQVAGVGVEGRNKWMELLKGAISREAHTHT